MKQKLALIPVVTQFFLKVWLVNSQWRTLSFDDVVFELLPQ